LKWLAVVNRAAGRSHEAERCLAALERMPSLSAVATFTDGPGSGTRIARDARDFDGLIVIGGDGTISECLTGMDLPRQKLAVIPAGHGNCLVRDLCLSRPADALEALQHPCWRALDLMEVTVESSGADAARRLCASTLAVGYVTEVVTAGRRRFAGLGHAAYGAAAMLTVPRPFRARADVTGFAGNDWQTYTGFVVNNTAHLANFRAFPQARLDDGVLDVMWQDCGWLRQLAHNVAVLAGSTKFGARAMQQSARVDLRVETPGTLMADGELLPGITRLSVACRQAAVTCVMAAP
jgi:diacylglycerol kinase (ATP)